MKHKKHILAYVWICQNSTPIGPTSATTGTRCSKLISSNAPTYDFYLWELLRSELTYLLSLFCAWNITTAEINSGVHLLTYLKVKSVKCLWLLPVVLVLLFWSCKQRSWS